MTAWAEPDTARKKAQFSPYFLDGCHLCFEITVLKCYNHSNLKDDTDHKVNFCDTIFVQHYQYHTYLTC